MDTVSHDRRMLQIAIDALCNSCNTLRMTSSATLPDDPDLRPAVIADAATRLKMTQRLAELGMSLAEEVCERAINSPYHPEPKHEPARAFANVSRSVRLTLVLQEKIEARLIALRNGAALFTEAGGAVRAKCGNGGGERPAAPDDIRDERADGSDSSRESLRERESERFDELVSGPFEDCVAAIRADLGLEANDEIALGDEGARKAIEHVVATASIQAAVSEAPHAAASIERAGARSPDPPGSGLRGMATAVIAGVDQPRVSSTSPPPSRPNVRPPGAPSGDRR